MKWGRNSYYFSRFTHNWGWATWRRAWKSFNHNLLPESEKKHVWDVAWEASVKAKHGLSIIPAVNLVSNIGSGKDATHTKAETKEINLPSKQLNFPLKHPKKIKRNINCDFTRFSRVYMSFCAY